MKNILITGGLGYIGSHGVVAFEEAGYNTIIVDNLENSSIETLERIGKILQKTPKFYEADIRDFDAMDKIFSENKIYGVVHFAGLKAANESCEKPLLYFDNNVIGSIKLLEVMQKHGCKNIIFSSSAAIYNADNVQPSKEGDNVGETSNPYGTTKYIIEKILNDSAKFLDFRVINLRYFNLIGAHSSGLIGEYYEGKPNNIFPYIMKVIFLVLEKVTIFGNDYDTIDGTGVRDYIDVNDLIDGHVLALEKIKSQESGIFETYNLGVGRGISVLELIRTCEKVIGKSIPYEFSGRRQGDLGIAYCDPSKAERLLNWKASRSVEDSVRSGIRFYEMILKEK